MTGWRTGNRLERVLRFLQFKCGRGCGILHKLGRNGSLHTWTVDIALPLLFWQCGRLSPVAPRPFVAVLRCEAPHVWIRIGHAAVDAAVENVLVDRHDRIATPLLTRYRRGRNNASAPISQSKVSQTQSPQQINIVGIVEGP